ncbi:hypothetical protein Ahy_A07g037380 isoform A [Arachis hypogaea]|uniref:Uncharacterized protein n=1 Tax=Arachis hypogaea TaxID=3818 RepID=A0A445CIL6_ARAHY|nr:hypothetical protein Ahy_A07g037380 isoform A [Arachis hypogaea]
MKFHRDEISGGKYNKNSCDGSNLTEVDDVTYIARSQYRKFSKKLWNIHWMASVHSALRGVDASCGRTKMFTWFEALAFSFRTQVLVEVNYSTICISQWLQRWRMERALQQEITKSMEWLLYAMELEEGFFEILNEAIK